MNSFVIDENYTWIGAYVMLSVGSMALCFKMRRYFLQKNLMLVNVTDLISADRTFIHAFSTIITSVICVARLIHGPFEEIIANLCVVCFIFSWGVMFPYVLALSIVKYLVVAHYHWLNTILDRHIQLSVRIVTVLYSMSCIISGRVVDKNFFHVRLYYFLNDDVETKREPIRLMIILWSFPTFLAAVIHFYTEYKLTKMRIQDQQALTTTANETENKKPRLLPEELFMTLRNQRNLLLGCIIVSLPIPLSTLGSWSSYTDSLILMLNIIAVGGIGLPLLECFLNKGLRNHIFAVLHIFRNNTVGVLEEV